MGMWTIAGTLRVRLGQAKYMRPWYFVHGRLGMDSDHDVSIAPTGASTEHIDVGPAGTHPTRQRVPTPQWGHRRSAGFCGASVNGSGGAGVCRSVLQSFSASRRCGLARKPKWRILTKPAGRTWRRKRRINSTASSVMSLVWLPLAESLQRKVTRPSFIVTRRPLEMATRCV